MIYQERVAIVTELNGDSDVTVVTFDIDRLPTEPLYPALLLKIEGGSSEVALELHKYISSQDLTFTYETYDWTGPFPKIGDSLTYRGLWIPGVLELVADTSLEWQRERYPDDGNHHHCPMTYETLAAYDPYQKEGYRCGDEWISVEAFETYIKNDRLRVRRGAAN